MADVIHFNSQKERLDYLKGKMEEIIPQEVIPQGDEKNRSKDAQKPSEGTSADKPKKNGKVKKDGKVQA